jgi:mono/diheme cytochrome c family protein
VSDTVTGKISSLGGFFIALIAVTGAVELANQPVMARQVTPVAGTEPGALLQRYCIGCHNKRLRTAGLALDELDATNVRADAEIWEKVVQKLRAGSMPPPGRPRPDTETYRAVAVSIEDKLDHAWLGDPYPGRIGAVHRLNRTEYRNVIRDLFDLDVDVESLLPGDETADGSFDNFADVLTFSTSHLERYLSVARQVTRQAVGLLPITASVDTFEVPLHIVQDARQDESLPLGSRGGIAIPYHFPVDGNYQVTVRLRRQYQDYLMGMGWAQQLDIRVDGELMERFTVGGSVPGVPAAASYAGDGEPGFAGDPAWETFMQLTGDDGLVVQVPVTAGPHVIGVSFVRQQWEPEGLWQPQQRGRVLTNDQIYMGNAAIAAVDIGGPFSASQNARDTPSRRAIYVCQPSNTEAVAERMCASEIIQAVARRAFRRPVTSDEIESLLIFFDAGRRDGQSFDSGIQFALERILVDPDFLLRVYRDPVDVESAQSPYELSDIELASRLSFFLWSSIPDERLLALAERGELSDPSTLEAETRRLLADPRSTETLVNDFAAQWLNLRRVGEVVVDPRQYPTYDETLLEAFVEELERFVASTITEDQSVRGLLDTDYTFANERLARHYGIEGVYGSRFRRVTIDQPNQRGGLLAAGALLATTSYPDRTSPVLRGKWLVDNIFGWPIPPPPPGVDTTLETTSGTQPDSIRERLARHRENPSCASCHSVIDPLGFALENFDVIGGWRTEDEQGRPVDSTGTTLAGETVAGLSGLRALLLDDPERFPRTVVEKLLAYALGRRLEYYDRPTVRQIVRDAAVADYRWSSIILGIIRSPAFTSRASAASIAN